LPLVFVVATMSLVDRSKITPALACGLVADQFPQWAELPVRSVELPGWDNLTFRPGDSMSVRLPSGPDYVPQAGKEHRWLPVLAPQLPLPIPAPLAQGQPGRGCPWPWSVYRWLDGGPAAVAVVADMGKLAVDLAGFLAARGRGWALWKALTTAVEAGTRRPRQRDRSLGVIDAILGEYSGGRYPPAVGGHIDPLAW
jgi:aminoglycoside phosphotransferase (APT) family kinase protein